MVSAAEGILRDERLYCKEKYPMKYLHIDFETRSAVDLKTYGNDVYAHHPSTEILMMAYAFGDAEVQLWEPHLSPFPADVAAALTDPAFLKCSWNVQFEQEILSAKLGFTAVMSQWFDPASHSRYLGFPGNLDEAGEVLKINLDYMKSKEGKKLLNLFSKLIKAKKPTKKNPAGVPEHFNDWVSHPEEWQALCTYCKQDVVAERAVRYALNNKTPFPASEHKIWCVDQQINRRGIPIDLNFAGKALQLVENERVAINYEMAKITDCENPNSPAQLKEWLWTQGYGDEGIGKDKVAESLKNGDITDDARKILELRQLVGGIAFKKLPVIQRWTRNNRLHDAFLYHAAHTGRWSSKGVQFHNLLKPTKRVAENYDAIVNAILNGLPMPADIPVVEAVSGCLRATVKPPEGSRLMVADYSSVENRVLGWISECPGIMEVFSKGLDPYKAFAALMYGIPYDQVTKEQRNFCKSPVLGCGFGMGANRLVYYAANMGQTITEEQAKQLVKAWRYAYPEVVEYWDTLGAACNKAVAKKIHLQLGLLRLDGRDPGMFHITLPSGRQLNYEQPKIEQNKFHQLVMTYMVAEDGMWKRTEARGSFLTENVVQAIARDLLANAMLALTDMEFPVVLHVHDELVAEVPYTSPLTYHQFEQCMVTLPAWAVGMPIKAEGFECVHYRK